MGEAMSQWRRACSLADLKSRSLLGVDIDFEPIALGFWRDECFAFSDVCPHAEALLSTGFLDEAVVECPLHGARFDIRTGRCLGGPAGRPVRTFPVQVDGDDVLVNLSAQS
jgi:3-phenylpropionate/trans-cinnamate dioxygenase ferredoxin subunit